MAFAFSILGAFYAQITNAPRLIIDNKQSVQKTFPDFFKHIRKHFGILTKGIILEDNNHSNNYNNSKPILDREPIFIVGMRGAGKSHFSRNICQNLGLRELCID